MSGRLWRLPNYHSVSHFEQNLHVSEIRNIPLLLS
jgi:hypothetical protein